MNDPYEFLEVYRHGLEVKPGEGHTYDDDLYIGPKYGIPWWYQIGVAGGEREFEGARYNGKKIHDERESYAGWQMYIQTLENCLQNYRDIINNLYSLYKSDILSLNDKFYRHVGLVTMAQQWFQNAYKKIPDGDVKYDTCLSLAGITHEDLEKYDGPNDNFKYLAKIGGDCEKVASGLWAPEKFQKKYEEYGRLSGKELLTDVADIGEIFGDAEVID
jgi:hypothetical protein